MTGLAVAARDLTMRFGDTRAVDGVTFDIAANTITGLLGRNGSGKTTLLSVIASLTRPSSGTVLVGGQAPFENGAVMERICLIRESGDVLSDEKISTNLDFVARARPAWDADYASDLVAAFGIDRDVTVSKLSRGQRSALGAVIGLASRAPVTMFDEVYLGMDLPTRQRFYDLMLADYVEHPRTIILSSHLIGEVEPLMENIIMLDHGRVIVDSEAESLRARGATITGPADRVDAAAAGLRVLRERTLGRTKQITVLAELSREDRGRLVAGGFEVGSVAIEDLFVHLTEETS